MTATLAVVLPIFALILLGWVAGRRDILGPAAVDVLNAFVVRLALPVLLFQFVADADWKSLWNPAFVGVTAGAMAVTFAAAWVLGRKTSGLANRSLDALTASYANTAFMGIPMAHGLLGATGLASAVIASLLTVFLLFAFGIMLVECDIHRDRGFGPAVMSVAASVACNPLVFAPVAGAVWGLAGIAMPAPLHSFASLLGATASPVALVTIGLFLASAPAGSVPASRVVILSTLKLVVQPATAFGLALLLGLSRPWTAAAVLAAMLPTGTGPFMLAQLYQLDAGAAARVVLLTTLISAVTIPIVSFLLL